MKTSKNNMFLFLVLIFPILTLHAQEKKIYYFDNDSKIISKDEFNKNAENQGYLSQTFEIDTAFIAVSFKRKNYGELDKYEFENLKSSLRKITNRTLDSDMFLIHYYPGATPCSRSIYPRLWNTSDPNYIKQINRITATDVLFIFKNDDELEETYLNKFEWFKDKEQVVEKLFFKYEFPCGSFVVISKTGNYISYYGEYSKQTVIDFVRELGKKQKK